MTKVKRQQIQAWMEKEQDQYLDDIGELNLTLMTEDAFNYFNPQSRCVNIPEEWFEIAFEVSEKGLKV